MKTICICCQKGGSSKSTTALNLCHGLANRGYKVLGLDMDEQLNFSRSTGIEVLKAESTVYDLMTGKATPQDARQSVKLYFDMIAGDLQLANADAVFSKTGRERLLKKALRLAKNDYDYCIIDTSPHLGVSTINALTAADTALIPITADEYCLEGLAQLRDVISSVKEYCNEFLAVSGILITKYNARLTVTQALMPSIQLAADYLGTRVYNTKIRSSVKVQESQILQVDLLTEYAKSTAAKDYESFITEFLESEA